MSSSPEAREAREAREASEGPSTADISRRALELLHATPHGRLSLSMRALPYLTVARHIVSRGKVMLRLHRGFGYHQVCDGSVVGYAADNLAQDTEDVWLVQFVGTARIAEPTERELELFGPAPRLADDTPFDPVYLRIEPRFPTVHSLSGVPERSDNHSE